MRSVKWKGVLAGALGILTSLALPSVASATSFELIDHGMDPNPGGLWGDVHFPGLGGGVGYEGAAIGRILLTGTGPGGVPVSFSTYCVDIFDWLHDGTFSEEALSSLPYDSARLTQLTTFLTHADPLVDTTEKSAAAQLGVWEILNESTGTAHDVTSGTFFASGGSLVGDDYNALALANTWLGLLDDGSWKPDAHYSLTVLDAGPNNQPQVFLAAQGAVPEPASWAMMIAGFGAVGTAMRRRGKVVAVA